MARGLGENGYRRLRRKKTLPRPLDADWHRADRMEKHIISFGWHGGEVKVCMLQFHRTGIFVHFPYHPDMPGLLSRGTVHAGEREQQVDLTVAGFVTSHKVKYTHHVDGNAHFSQDGRIRTAVRGRAPDLHTQRSHIFSIDVQGLAHFKEFRDEEYYGDKYGRGYFELQGPEPEAVHVIARWGMVSDGKRMEDLNNVVRFRAGGVEREAIAMAPPPASPLEPGFVIIEAEPQAPLSEEPFMLLFTGGFEKGLADPSVESAFLAMRYPVEDPGRLPSIDFQRNPSAE